MSTNHATSTFDRSLDRLEERLPQLPAAWLRFNRRLAEFGFGVMEQAGRATKAATDRIAGRAMTGARTVTGQTRSATREVVSTASSSAKQVVGQSRAQAGATIDVANDVSTELLESGAERLDRSMPDETWTRDELYELAQEQDVSGRASMNKADLLRATRRAASASTVS